MHVKIRKEKGGSNLMHDCMQKRYSSGKDSHSEWGDGKISISEFLEVSEEGTSMNFWFLGFFFF